MAKVIKSEQSKDVVATPWWGKGAIIYVGLCMGLLWWVLTALLRQYIVEPLACRDLSSATACINTVGISGNIATVIVAIVGMILLVRTAQPRPVLIAVAAAILLWGLGIVVDAFTWWGALLWAVFFYLTSYLLFFLVAKIPRLGGALLVAALLLAVVRLLLTL